MYSKVLYAPGGTIQYVYFLESGIVSLLAAVDKDATLEVGIVGNEGMVELPVYLGIKTTNNLAVVQGAESALRLNAADLLTECGSSDELPRQLRLFTYSLMVQIAQSAACNPFHPIDARLARWLLMTQDRMRSDESRITQGFLSIILGVRREAVNKAASGFQHRELIKYTRGKLSILNRAELEKVACSCYGKLSNRTIT